MERISCVAQQQENFTHSSRERCSSSFAQSNAPYSTKEIERRHTNTHTWSTVVLLHPDVTVALGNAGLGVQEGETHGALCAQTGIVAATVFNGLFVELLTETEIEKSGGRGEEEEKERGCVGRQRCGTKRRIHSSRMSET